MENDSNVDITEVIELLSAGIGFQDFQQGEFKPGSCPLKSLQRLRQILLKDKNKDIYLHIGKSNVVFTSLVPAFVYFDKDENVAVTCIELFMILTEPLQGEDLEEISTYQYEICRKKFRTAIIDQKPLSTLMQHFKQTLMTFFDENNLLLVDLLKLYVLTLKNLSYTKDFGLNSNFNENLSLHDKIIQNFSEELVLKSIVLLSNNLSLLKNEKNELCLAMLELFFNVICLEDCSFVVKKGNESAQRSFSNSKLESLRNKENKKIIPKLTNSNWSSRYTLKRKIKGNKLTNSLSTATVTNPSNRRKNPRIIKEKKKQERIYTNSECKKSITKFMYEIVDSGAFNQLSKNVFEIIRKETFNKNEKTWGKLFFFMAFTLYKTREDFTLHRKSAKSWINNLGRIKFALTCDFIRVILEYVEEIISFKGVKYAKIEWENLANPILLLKELTIQVYWGMKLTSVLEEKNLKEQKKILQLFYNEMFNEFRILKVLRFLLREFSVNRNTIEYLHSLVELTHYSIILSNEKNDNINAFTEDEQEESNDNKEKEDETDRLKSFNFKKISKCVPEMKSLSNTKAILPLCNKTVVTKYMDLLEDYNTNVPTLNFLVVNYIRMVVDSMNLRQMFYTAQNVVLFKRILNDKILKQSQNENNKTLVQLVERIVKSFCVELKKYPFLIVDSLFGITRKIAENINTDMYGLEEAEIEYTELCGNESDEEIDSTHSFIENGKEIEFDDNSD